MIMTPVIVNGTLEMDFQHAGNTGDITMLDY